MLDVMTGYFAYVLSSFTVSEVVSGLFFIILLLSLIHIINKKDNPLDWDQLVSSKGVDGIQYADWNKIGQGFGVVVAVWMPFYYVHSEKMDATGLALVMAASFAYLGGVSAYAAALRSKQNETKGESK